MLAEGCADMVSMARPLLADPDFVAKARGRPSRPDQHLHRAATRRAWTTRSRTGRVSCLVNPRAGHERDLVIAPDHGPQADRGRRRRAGRPGRRHDAGRARPRGGPVRRRRRDRRSVQPREADPRQGGVPRDAALLRQPDRATPASGCTCRRGSRPTTSWPLGVDEVVLATGVTPRDPHIPGQDGPNVVSYIDVLAGGVPVGERVAIVGAGGIGFDVAEFLVVAPGESPTLDLTEWRAEWGVADPARPAAGWSRRSPCRAARKVTLLQRKRGKLGAGLGKTTGWIHRSTLSRQGRRRCSRASTTSGSRPRAGRVLRRRSTSASASSRPTRSCCARGRSRCATRAGAGRGGNPRARHRRG